MYYILYRDPNSRLVGDWKVQGSAPCYSFEKLEDAERLAKEMNQNFFYDLQIVQWVNGVAQDGSGSNNHKFDN